MHWCVFVLLSFVLVIWGGGSVSWPDVLVYGLCCWVWWVGCFFFWNIKFLWGWMYIVRYCHNISFLCPLCGLDGVSAVCLSDCESESPCLFCLFRLGLVPYSRSRYLQNLSHTFGYVCEELWGIGVDVWLRLGEVRFQELMWGCCGWEDQCLKFYCCCHKCCWCFIYGGAVAGPMLPMLLGEFAIGRAGAFGY